MDSIVHLCVCAGSMYVLGPFSSTTIHIICAQLLRMQSAMGPVVKRKLYITQLKLTIEPDDNGLWDTVKHDHRDFPKMRRPPIST